MSRLVVEKGNEKASTALRQGRGDVHHWPFQSVRSRADRPPRVPPALQNRKVKELFVVSDCKHNGTYLNGVKLEDETMLMRAMCCVRRDGFPFHCRRRHQRRLDGWRKIGGYHLITRIGVGGMGEVYKATQITIGVLSRSRFVPESRWIAPSSTAS